ncbi:MAG: ribosome-recycling factor, partial [Planctomycetota bacterium]|nr:ribosome-recycling factor [Planctomycetota bacterium]
LKQVAVITVPQPNLLAIRPYEPSLVGEIQKALLKANLGLNVSSDAKMVRVTVPAPSLERREQLLHRAREIAENAKVAIRNIRKDAKKRAETLKKEGKLPEDDTFRLLDRIQDIVKKQEEKIDELLKKKEEEILNI